MGSQPQILNSGITEFRKNPENLHPMIKVHHSECNRVKGSLPVFILHCKSCK